MEDRQKSLLPLLNMSCTTRQRRRVIPSSYELASFTLWRGLRSSPRAHTHRLSVPQPFTQMYVVTPYVGGNTLCRTVHSIANGTHRAVTSKAWHPNPRPCCLFEGLERPIWEVCVRGPYRLPAARRKHVLRYDEAKTRKAGWHHQAAEFPKLVNSHDARSRHGNR